MALSTPAFAEWSVLSGYLYGTEPQIATPTIRDCYYTAPAKLGYSLVQPLTVSETGQYSLASVGGLRGYLAIYKGSFDPQNPRQNRIASLDFYSSILDDEGLQAFLQQGVEYRLLTSPWCFPDKGVWTVVAEGPGEVSSPATVTGLNPFQQGVFRADSDPQAQANVGCGVKRYHASGPQQVSRKGRYFLVDVSGYLGDSVCVGVYTSPFNPARPEQGRIALLDWLDQPVDLVPGQDYYFVATPRNQSLSFSYFYLVMPTGDVYFDPVLSGTWYNAETPGQGFSLDVLGMDQKIFLGWYTFDLQPPDAVAASSMGDSGQRWLTAYGTFQQADASLDIEVTTGGVFNQSSPVPAQYFDGEIRIHLFDCQSGELSFDLGSVGLAGTIPIQRLNSLAAGPCIDLLNRTGRPRPLMAD